jgi:aminoglycoside/choline kinase family phosphotransferase
MVSQPNPGVLDFQDAVYGPLTYDLVSLLKDAYLEWPEEFILDMVIRYWEKARKAGLPVQADIDSFYRDFEWMGVQRHLKVAGIFARLSHRDGKHAYLDDIPLVVHYLKRTCKRYTELLPLGRLIQSLVGEDEQVGYTF